MSATNLSRYRQGDYDSYDSDEAVLAAIEELAGESLPTGLDFDAMDREAEGEAYRLWADPSEEEQRAIESRAWQLAGSDEDRLFWGQHTVKRG
jgi:hypothetical protein